MASRVVRRGNEDLRSSAKIAVFVIVALLIVWSYRAGLLTLNNDTDAAPEPRDVSPFQLLDCGDQGFSDNETVGVRFYDNLGYSVNVTAVSPTPLEVAVPLYVDPTNGTLETAVVSMETIANGGIRSAIEGDVKIAVPLGSQMPPGALTSAFINSSLSSLGSARTSLDQVANDSVVQGYVTPDLYSEIDNYSARLIVLREGLRSISCNLVGEIDIGNVSTQIGDMTLKLDNRSISTSERIIKSFAGQMNVSCTMVSNGGLQLSARPANCQEQISGDVGVDWCSDLIETMKDDLTKYGDSISKYVGIGGGVIALMAALGLGATPAVALLTGVWVGVALFAAVWLVGIYGIGLSLGSQLLLDKSPEEANAARSIEYVVKNTLSNGLSQLASSAIGAISEVGSAVFDILDSAIGMMSRITDYTFDKSLLFAESYQPDAPVNAEGYWSGTYSLTVHTTYWDGSSWEWYSFSETGVMILDFDANYVYVDGRQVHDLFTGALLNTVEVEGNLNVMSSSESVIDGALEFTTLITEGIAAYPYQTFHATVSGDSIQGSLVFDSFELNGEGTFSVTRG